MVSRGAAIGAALALGGLGGLGACDYITSSFETNTFSGDPFPTLVQGQTGALVVGMTVDGDDTVLHTAVLDVMSPLNVLDEGASTPVSIDDEAGYTLLGETAPAGPFDIARAHFITQNLMTLHPCSGSGNTCTVGTPDAPQAFDAIIGMPSFGGDALQLDLAEDAASGSDTIYILPNIAGSETRLSYACNAVFPVPFRGGGTIIVGGTELAFTNWRIAMQACLSPDPDPALVQSQRGTDALFVVSTAIGTSILAESAYERYQLDHPEAPDSDTLPAATVLLEDGPITGHQTTLPTMAFVAISTTNQRAPCRQVWASHLLAQHDCTGSDDCPCNPATDPNDGTFCAVPADVELAPPDGFDILIVDDSNDTLQSLRTELEPDEPQVDGILGTQALRQIQLGIDYPDDRLVAKCANPDPSVCIARPEIAQEEDRTQVQGCLMEYGSAGLGSAID